MVHALDESLNCDLERVADLSRISFDELNSDGVERSSLNSEKLIF